MPIWSEDLNRYGTGLYGTDSLCTVCLSLGVVTVGSPGSNQHVPVGVFAFVRGKTGESVYKKPQILVLV